MSKEDLEFLIDLQDRMNKQDESPSSCDFQASPYFWGVAENKIEWGIDPDYCSDEVCYYYDGEEYNSIEECKELFKDLIDEEDDDYETQLKEIENISDWCDIDNYNDENDIDGNIVYGRKVEDVISKHTGCFLTKQACKEHIEKYGYNYSEPHTFAMTADRNPEFEKVWNILKKTDWKQISDLEAKLSESESELEKQKEKYDKLYGCYKKTSSEDLQDKYRLAEENEQLKKQLQEIKNVKSQELANYLHTSIPKYIVNEKVQLLEKAKERIKKLNFYGLSVSTQQAIKISVCHEIDQLIRELKEGDN